MSYSDTLRKQIKAHEASLDCHRARLVKYPGHRAESSAVLIPEIEKRKAHLEERLAQEERRWPSVL